MSLVKLYSTLIFVILFACKAESVFQILDHPHNYCSFIGCNTIKTSDDCLNAAKNLVPESSIFPANHERILYLSGVPTVMGNVSIEWDPDIIVTSVNNQFLPRGCQIRGNWYGGPTGGPSMILNFNVASNVEHVNTDWSTDLETCDMGLTQPSYSYCVCDCPNEDKIDIGANREFQSRTHSEQNAGCPSPSCDEITDLNLCNQALQHFNIDVNGIAQEIEGDSHLPYCSMRGTRGVFNEKKDSTFFCLRFGDDCDMQKICICDKGWDDGAGDSMNGTDAGDGGTDDDDDDDDDESEVVSGATSLSPFW